MKWGSKGYVMTPYPLSDSPQPNIVRGRVLHPDEGSVTYSNENRTYPYPR